MSVVFVFVSTIGRAAFTGNHLWIIHDPANDHSLRSEVQFLHFPCELILMLPNSSFPWSTLLPPYLKRDAKGFMPLQKSLWGYFVLKYLFYVLKFWHVVKFVYYSMN